MSYLNHEETLDWLKKTRPWWWFVNPWLYIKRRDIAYAEALDMLTEYAMMNRARQ